MVANGPRTAARLGATPKPDTLACELCSKTYQRRDLLMRHRRRCQGVIKPQNRRKACDACVAAKTRCSYELPNCSRCNRRGTPCNYASKPGSNNEVNPAPIEIANDPEKDSSDPSDTSGTPVSPSSQTLYHRKSLSLTTSEGMDLPVWDTTGTASWPLESFDISLQSTLQDPMSLLNFGTTVSADTMMTTDLPMTNDLSFSQMTSHDRFQSTASATGLPFSSSPWNLPLSMQKAQSPHSMSSLDDSFSSSSSPLEISQLLGDYVSKLLCENFTSPLLHRSLYSDAGAGMTTLPFTSMAICCGTGMETRTSRRYVRRAMHAERRRLTEIFSSDYSQPSCQRIQQWDALHAMLLYELLELRESLDDDLETWKSKPKAKWLHPPVLVKMVKCYARSFPAIRSHDVNVFSDTKSAPAASSGSSWDRWRITETARRTIFFANIINFYLNYNRVTGQQSVYYEALDDDLIRNMPLPCSEEAWAATDELSWLDSVQGSACSLAPKFAPEMSSECCSIEEPTLNSMLSGSSKDYIQQMFGQHAGFEDSNRLRSLIMLCACEQYR